MKLVTLARVALPDRLAKIDELQGRPVYAMDGGYQSESAHFKGQRPKHGGKDSPKGHVMLTFFDIRLGAPIGVQIETRNTYEMLVLKAYGDTPDSLLAQRDVLWLADRAYYVDMPFWDRQYTRYRQTIITRMKSNLVIEASHALPFKKDIVWCRMNALHSKPVAPIGDASAITHRTESIWNFSPMKWIWIRASLRFYICADGMRKNVLIHGKMI